MIRNLLIFTFIPILLNADELTFEKCAELLSQNVEVKAAAEEVLAKKSILKSISSNYFPKLKGNIQIGTERFGEFMRTEEGSLDSYSISLAENLFDGFRTKIEVEEAAEDVTLSEINLKILKSKLSAELKISLANLIYSRELKKYTEDLTKRRKENLEMVQLRFQNGRENQGSVLLYRAYLSLAYLEQKKALNSYFTTLEELKRMVNLPPDKKVEFVGDIISLSSALLNTTDYFSLLDQSLSRQMAFSALRKSRLLLRKAESPFYPSLNLIGSWGKLSSYNQETREQWYLRLELNIPIFDGGRDYYSLQSVKALARSQLSKLENIERQLLNEIQKTQYAVKEAQEEYQVSDEFLSAAQTRAKIARSKCNNGLIAFDEWDNIESDLIAKSKNLILMKKNLILSEAQWELAIGKSVLPL